MSDTDQAQNKQTFLTILGLLLLLAVSVQSWYMYEMKKQLDSIPKQHPTVQAQLKTTATETEKLPEMLSETQPESLPKKQPEILPIKAQTEEQAEETGVDDKVITSETTTETGKTTPSAETQQPSVPQDQGVTTAQLQNKSLPADNTSPYTADDSINRFFDDPTWDPYLEIERMQRDMDRLFNNRLKRLYDNSGFYDRPGFNGPGFNGPGFYDRPRLHDKPRFSDNSGFHRHFSQSTSTPEIKVKENNNQYMVFVNLPGAEEKDISVTLDGQRLTIKGKQEHKKQNRDASGNIIFQQRSSGRFSRSITLAEPVRQNEMKIWLDNGVLKIKIPKEKFGP